MDERKEKITLSDKRRIKSLDDLDSVIEDADLERVPSVVARLEAQARERDERLREYIAARKAERAEMDQFRKRLEADVENRALNRFGEALKEILCIIDDLDRVIEASSERAEDSALLEGVVLTRDKIIDTLKRSGLEPIDALGRKFDPEKARALGVVEVDDPERDGIVVEQSAPGYEYNGRTLREALVHVGAYKRAE